MRRRGVVTVLLAAALLAVAVKPARADEPTVVPLTPPPPPARGAWYGWQVLALDAASIGATLLNGSEKPMMGYVWGSPIVHTVHRGWKRGLASLALRVGLPLAGGLVAYYGGSCAKDSSGSNEGLNLCGLDDAVVGAVVGGVLAIGIDSIWAFDDVPPPPTTPAPAPRTSPSSWSLTPTLKITGDGTGIGLSGRF